MAMPLLIFCIAFCLYKYACKYSITDYLHSKNAEDDKKCCSDEYNVSNGLQRGNQSLDHNF